MATTVNMHEAKTHFSKLVQRVLAGEEIIVARAGKPVAKIVALDHKPKQRLLGMDKGKVVIGPNFDDPLPEFEEYI